MVTAGITPAFRIVTRLRSYSRTTGKTLTDAVYAAEELEEAAKLFIMLRGVEARLLTPAQVDDLVATFG